MRRTINLIVLLIALTTLTTEVRAQLVGPFTDARIRKYEGGDLDASYTRQADSITVRVKSKRGGDPEDGFAGVCIENASAPVPLTSFTKASAMFRASAAMTIDVKLEKTKAQEGVLFLDGSKRLKAGDNPLRWKLTETEDTSPQRDTLSQVKRLCVFILADEFPGKADEVVLTIGPFGFDR